MNKNIIIYVSAAALILIGILVFFLTQNDNTKPANKRTVDINLLLGDWIRTDAQYLIRITRVNNDGTTTAQYFNPNPINVGNANWEQSYGNLKVIVEMRDVNYPGSKYTLNYLPERDVLAGEYYQAVEGLTFYVELVRNK